MDDHKFYRFLASMGLIPSIDCAMKWFMPIGFEEPD